VARALANQWQDTVQFLISLLMYVCAGSLVWCISVFIVWFSEVSAADKPFYQRWWFLVIIALVGVIIVLIVVGVLYVTGKKRRQKAKSLFQLLTHSFL